MTIKVSEVFRSIQGEGINAGVPAVFIRLSGCPLYCSFCDSKFASRDLEEPEFIVQPTPRSIKDFIEVVRQEIYKDGNRCNLVVITGGEPLVDENLETLTYITNYLVNLEYVRVDFETSLVNNIEDIVEQKTSMKQRLASILDRLFTFNYSFRRETDSLLIPQGYQQTVRLFDGEIIFYPDRFPYAGFFIVSPKLDLNCYANKIDDLEQIFNYYLGDITLNDQMLLLNFVRFKLLYLEELEDAILKFVDRLNKIFQNDDYVKELVCIMPLSQSDTNLSQEIKKRTFEFCKYWGLRFSPRLHVDIYGLDQRKV